MILSAPAGGELRAELAALLEKYRAMLRLRLASESDKSRGVRHDPSRDELRALSRAFPGVLAELDRVPFALLEERRDVLAALVEREAPAPLDPTNLPLWLRGMLGFHRGLRGALALKLWLALRRNDPPPSDAELEAAIPALAEADLARAWIGWFSQLRSPPNRRIVDLVLARVGDELGLAPDALRRMLMPRPHEN